MIEIFNMKGLEFLKGMESNSVDLILTDPPYITSRTSGMDKWNEKVKSNKFKQKTEAEWIAFKESLSCSIQQDLTEKDKENYIRYGDRFGKRFAYTTDYGDWDKEFTLDQLDCFIQEFYRVLKHRGTCIIFFDLWKISYLKERYENHKFKQIRFIEWLKTNPVPINSNLNYLTNSREIAISAVKKSKPTFHSKYDNGVYKFPIYSGKDRFHPTQKSLPLFIELIRKHSHEGDLVLDPFSGSGTTAVASLLTDRNFKGCEMIEEYHEKSIKRVEDYKQKKEKECT